MQWALPEGEGSRKAARSTQRRGACAGWLRRFLFKEFVQKELGEPSWKRRGNVFAFFALLCVKQSDHLRRSSASQVGSAEGTTLRSLASGPAAGPTRTSSLPSTPTTRRKTAPTPSIRSRARASGREPAAPRTPERPGATPRRGPARRRATRSSPETRPRAPPSNPEQLPCVIIVTLQRLSSAWSHTRSCSRATRGSPWIRSTAPPSAPAQRRGTLDRISRQRRPHAPPLLPLRIQPALPTPTPSTAEMR